MTAAPSADHILSPQRASVTVAARQRGLPALLERIPHSLIALLGRFSIAATFWLSGQTKVEGFAIDIIHGTYSLGVPRLSESAIELFRNEYALPLLSPVLAAQMAATAEHVFPVLLLLGLGTRFAALALLAMTLVIQIFVYPDAYATHGVWATVLIYLIARGAGVFSLDHLIARRGRGSIDPIGHTGTK